MSTPIDQLQQIDGFTAEFIDIISLPTDFEPKPKKKKRKGSKRKLNNMSGYTEEPAAKKTKRVSKARASTPPPKTPDIDHDFEMRSFGDPSSFGINVQFEPLELQDKDKILESSKTPKTLKTPENPKTPKLPWDDDMDHYLSYPSSPKTSESKESSETPSDQSQAEPTTNSASSASSASSSSSSSSSSSVPLKISSTKASSSASSSSASSASSSSASSSATLSAPKIPSAPSQKITAFPDESSHETLVKPLTFQFPMFLQNELTGKEAALLAEKEALLTPENELIRLQPIASN